jgi:predicted RNase H-like HicB family nuclease
MPNPNPLRRFSADFELEQDGRWICEIPTIPGVMVYGKTPVEAFDAAVALAEEVIAEKIREESY